MPDLGTVLGDLRQMIPPFAWQLGAMATVWMCFSFSVRLWYRVRLRAGTIRPLRWSARPTPPERISAQAADQLELPPSGSFWVRPALSAGLEYVDNQRPPPFLLRGLLTRIRTGTWFLHRLHNPGTDELTVRLPPAERTAGGYLLLDLPARAVCACRAEHLWGFSSGVRRLRVSRKWHRPTAWSTGLVGLLTVEGPGQLLLWISPRADEIGPGSTAVAERLVAFSGGIALRPTVQTGSGDYDRVMNTLGGPVQVTLSGTGLVLTAGHAKELVTPSPLQVVWTLLKSAVSPLP